MDSPQTESPQTLLNYRNKMNKINESNDSDSNDDSMMKEMQENLKQGSKIRKKHGTVDRRTKNKKIKSKEEQSEKLIGTSETSKSSKKSRFTKMQSERKLLKEPLRNAKDSPGRAEINDGDSNSNIENEDQPSRQVSFSDVSHFRMFRGKKDEGDAVSQNSAF